MTIWQKKNILKIKIVKLFFDRFSIIIIVKNKFDNFYFQYDRKLPNRHFIFLLLFYEYSYYFYGLITSSYCFYQEVAIWGLCPPPKKNKIKIKNENCSIG